MLTPGRLASPPGRDGGRREPLTPYQRVLIYALSCLTEADRAPAPTSVGRLRYRRAPGDTRTAGGRKSQGTDDDEFVTRHVLRHYFFIPSNTRKSDRSSIHIVPSSFNKPHKTDRSSAPRHFSQRPTLINRVTHFTRPARRLVGAFV